MTLEADMKRLTKQVDEISQLLTQLVSDTAYAVSWDAVDKIAPSKNAVYDKIEDVSGDLVDVNTELDLKCVCVNGAYTGDGTGNNANWNAGAYKEIDLSAYLSSILYVVVTPSGVAEGGQMPSVCCMANEGGRSQSILWTSVYYAMRIIAGGKFQVADKAADGHPNKNGQQYVYVAWGVKA